MSLIHWWPLNGNLKDYGIKNSSVTTHGTPTYSNSGKIGKAPTMGSSFYFDSPCVIATNKMSLAFWVYPNNVSQWRDIFSIGTNLGRIELTNTSTYVYYWYQTNNGGYNLADSQSIFTLGNQQWYHITMTIDGINVKFYVNGILQKTITQRNQLSNVIDDNLITWGRRGVTDTGGFGGMLNDIRIYDHALSVKEIKEISKGLVLHYTFEDAYAEGTTNLLNSSYPSSTPSTYNSSFQTLTETYYGNPVIRCTGTSSTNSGFRYGVSVNLASGESVTFSLYLRYNGSKTNFSSYHAGSADGSYRDPLVSRVLSSGGTGQSTWVKETVTIYDENRQKVLNWDNVVVGKWYFVETNLTNIFSSQITISNYYFLGGSNAGTWDIACPQLEKKDHATPYVNGTRQPGLIYDSSGYGRNATPVNNPQILEDSGCGVHCVNLTNATNGYFDLGTATFNFVTSGTVCFWAKYTDSSYKMILGANDSGAKYLAANTPNGSSSSGNWYGMVSTSNCYCDGEVYAKPKIDSQWHFYCFTGINFSNWGELKYFLCIYANNPNNSFQFHGYLADFKIYSTVLSASDILAEYNRKASIDRDGNLYTGEFVEENDRINIAKTDVVEASVFEEGTSLVKMTDKYVELEYIQSDGNQWMDSKVSITANLNVYCKIQWTNISGSYPMLYGAWSIFSLSSMPSSKLCIASGGYSGNNPWSAGPSVSANVIYHIKHQPNKLTINNVLYTIPNAGATNNASARHVLLFAASNTGNTPYNWSTYCKAKMYRFEIYDGSEQVRNFIPAKRKSDNVVGLYDTVNRQFYTNSGSGSFTAGPEKGNLSIVYSKQIIEN